MAGSFKCDDFKKKMKMLFENEDLEVAEEGDEKIYDDLKDAAKKVSDVASGISTVEDLENDGTLSDEAHQAAEAKLSAELDAAIEDLVTNHEDFKKKEAEEGNPGMVDGSEVQRVNDMSGEVEAEPKEAGEESTEEESEEEEKEEESK